MILRGLERSRLWREKACSIAFRTFSRQNVGEDRASKVRERRRSFLPLSLKKESSHTST